MAVSTAGTRTDSGSTLMARRCAYLTMENPAGWTIDAELGFPPLEAMGWQIDSLPWRSEDIDWDLYDAVYIGTPWDYPEDPDRFRQVLERADQSRAVLVNDIALVRWTIPKTYLRDVENKGVAIVPSIWGETMDVGLIENAFTQFDVDKLIVKPVISTNATNTFLFARETLPDLIAQLSETFAGRPYLVQPFISNIQSEGEYSLFYFNRVFSHAIQKIPKPDDFRVQEEYGAEIIPVDPEPALREAGDQLMNVVDPMPVYGRADFVRGLDGRFLVMELELIEPSMYLRMNKEAPQRFAEAFDNYVSNVSGGNKKCSEIS
jgi:hypothetical protein